MPFLSKHLKREAGCRQDGGATPKGVFDLGVIIALHDDPAHHVKKVGQLQEAGDVWVDLDGEVLQLLLGGVDTDIPRQEISHLPFKRF